MQQESKWWGESMTIWGAMLTGVTTVLPVLARLGGIDLSADLLGQLGRDFSGLVQAAGGLAGTVMTVWGRIRATSRLERRELSVKL